MLRPGTKVFDPLSLIALGCAIAFAIYQILTRYVSSDDNPDTSLFYTGITGFVILVTPISNAAAGSILII